MKCLWLIAVFVALVANIEAAPIPTPLASDAHWGVILEALLDPDADRPENLTEDEIQWWMLLRLRDGTGEWPVVEAECLAALHQRREILDLEGSCLDGLQEARRVLCRELSAAQEAGVEVPDLGKRMRRLSPVPPVLTDASVSLQTAPSVELSLDTPLSVNSTSLLRPRPAFDLSLSDCLEQLQREIETLAEHRASLERSIQILTDAEEDDFSVLRKALAERHTATLAAFQLEQARLRGM